MKNGELEHGITEDVVETARANPNGWVYKIEGSFAPTDYVPPEAVVGAWRVDKKGNLTGEFVPNPNYKPNLPKSEK
ncbi:hypothetical protein [Pseudoduganella chitinolytica]|uniref:Bacterial EndoU nuclease domain-containing protein n=1 Tax=Pseudoduganella chitinolytica TaxID=34070 RepID=A0ABY8BDS8_9BURK|nr:hypothetical protein [Pseudoduganella chitinolytica]WEF32872.1 hypothetical protein PX653_26340 [Pseudoduganella chitinolytica]